MNVLNKDHTDVIFIFFENNKHLSCLTPNFRQNVLSAMATSYPLVNAFGMAPTRPMRVASFWIWSWTMGCPVVGIEPGSWTPATTRWGWPMVGIAPLAKWLPWNLPRAGRRILTHCATWNEFFFFLTLKGVFVLFFLALGVGKLQVSTPFLFFENLEPKISEVLVSRAAPSRWASQPWPRRAHRPTRRGVWAIVLYAARASKVARCFWFEKGENNTNSSW